jgi:hypothetical protein
MKLELKHLAPYLPYGLKVQGVKHREKFNNSSNYLLNGLALQDCGNAKYEFIHKGELIFAMVSDKNWKPILRPLSDLTKEITVNGEDFVPYEHHIFIEAMTANEYLEYLCEAKADLSEDRLLPYSIVHLLFEWHFDVFGLIDKGLAIDINTLNKYETN